MGNNGGYDPNSPGAYGQKYKPYAQADSPDPLQLGGGQGPEYDPQGARDAYASGNMAQGGQSAFPGPSSDPYHGGYAQPGGESYGTFQAGGAGGGPTSSGSRVGSVNYGAYGALTNLAQNDPQGAAQLRAMGMMPTYNGQSVDTIQSGQNMGAWKPGKGGVMWDGSTQRPDGSYVFPDGHVVGADGRSAVAGPGGAAPGAGGMGGAGATAPGTGLPLEGEIEGGYSSLIGNKGHVLNPLEESGLVNQGQDTIAHGERDAIDSARLDAIRRGDTSGSTVGSREDAIRMAGTADQAKSALGTRTALDQDAGNRMLSALGGATGMYGQELGNVESLRQLALLQGQQGQGNVQALMNLK